MTAWLKHIHSGLSLIFSKKHEFSEPFFGGFGLQTIHGIPKPSYRAFEFMHQLGTKRLKAEGNRHDTVEMIATLSDGDIVLLVYNHQIPGDDISAQEVSINISGCPIADKVELYRIDENSANPKRRWKELGSIEYPGKDIFKNVYEASVPVCEQLTPSFNAGVLKIDFNINIHSVVLIKIRL